MQRFLKVCFVVTIALLALVLSSGQLNAQATASISGTITDTSGAAVPDAGVQVRNIGTGVTQTIMSDAQGRYRVPELIIGDYEVQGSKMGFATVLRKGITLTVGSEPVVDFQLGIGQQSQTVTVEGAVSQVETQSTAVGSLVESKEMRDLPLNGRNYTQLLTLAPGVTIIPLGAPGAAASNTFFGNGTRYSIAGSRPQGQAYLLDNQDMVGFWNNGPGSSGLGSALGIEAIAEFQTLTNTYSSQYGGNGAVVNAASRSGTNAFHGSAYEFLRNDALEARNYFDNAVLPGSTTAKPPTFRQNQFGGSVGGAIKKDKAFFFVNYEGLRRTQIVTSAITVPDACAAQFRSTSASGACGAAIAQNSNPSTRLAVQNTLALYPRATYVPEIFGPTGVASGTGQALVADPSIGKQNYVLGRFDYTVSDKSSIFLRYVLDHANRDATAAGQLPYWPEYDRTRDHFVSLEERQIISARLVNLLRLGFSRTAEDAYIYGSPVVQNGVASFGTIATPVTANGQLAGGVTPASNGQSPGVHPLQFFNITDPTSQFYATTTGGRAILREDGAITPGSGIAALTPASTLPFYLIPNKFELGDDLIWTSGAHSVKVGFSALWDREALWEPFQDGPQWVFPNETSFLQGNAVTVQGLVSNTQNPGADATKDNRYWIFGIYAEDQWKISSRVTVNLGLRYSPASIISQSAHQEFALTNAPFGNWTPTTQSTGSNPSLRNWDPRIGIAFDPFSNHKTSIRASFGMFHSVLYSRDLLYTLAPPYLTGLQTTSSSTPIQFPFPNSQIPVGSGTVIPTNGTLTCTNCTNYNLNNTPYQMQWNFNIQREIMANTVASIGYVGSHNVHLPQVMEFNSPIPVIGPSGQPTFGVFNGSNAVLPNPRLNPAYSYLQFVNNVADSHYEALQLSLNKRFSSNWQTQASYTYSKSIDDSSATYGGEGAATPDPYNLSLDRSLSTFNRTHNFHLSAIYTVPTVVKGFLGQAVNGWQLADVFTYLSGAPAPTGTITNRVDNSLGAVSPRPNAVGGGCQLLTGVTPEQATNSGTPWFNASCFTPAPLGTYGNAGRDVIIGPNLWGTDFSLTKNWKVTKVSEQFNVQFRAEAFNVLNHPTFQNPNAAPFNAALSSAVNAASSGSCSPASNATLAPCGVSLNASSGRITATNSSPRQIQLALKITF
jgi:hypothetical protein